VSHRDHLPQLDGGVFLTDGGLETVLIFHQGIDLPLFAAVDLLNRKEGTGVLRRYFDRYAELAREHGAGLVLESPTWRASPRWGAELGYTAEQLEELNRRAIALMVEVRDAHSPAPAPIVISGCVGPQDDGYDPAQRLSARAAQDYHATQIDTFAGTDANMVNAMTMTYVDEAVGVTRAAAEAGMPVAISFTVETDGRLPSGEGLGEAIAEVDRQTGGGPAYYMLNCAHPTHFDHVLAGDEPWTSRILGLRANASMRSHAELDEAEELDEGDPADLGARYAALAVKLPRLTVLGGCCGTDDRHVAEICRAWTDGPAAARV
jgi:S-methylmethionine-dependent homocysteine/selenocysteine methylase